MMALPAPQTVTRALWAANLLALLLLLGVAASRVWTAFAGSGEVLPDIAPLKPGPVTLVPVAPDIGERNPFDTSGQPWRPAPAGAEAPGSGALRGVVILPGARFAVTDRGMSKAGDLLAEGKVLGIQTGSVVVDANGTRQALDLPSEKRPRLADLNRAAADRKP